MTRDEARVRLGRIIRNERLARYGTKQDAYRAAGVSPATWDRVEAGQPVRDDRLAKVFKAIDWSVSQGWAVLGGDEPPELQMSIYNSGDGVEDEPEPERHVSRTALRESIERSDQPAYIKQAMLALLDSDDEPHPPSPRPPESQDQSEAG